MEGEGDGREMREIKGMVGKRKMESRGRWRGREMEEEGDGGEGRWKAEGAGVEGDGGGGYRGGGRWKGRKMEGKEDGGEDGGGGRPVELVVTAQTLQSTLSQFYACVYCIIVSNQ